METTQQNKILAIEKIFVKPGKIIAVRDWNGGNIHEVDVYLPNVYFNQWDKAQSIKCRVAALHYTDYTPALWETEEKICTLYIDTSHHGPGSIWAKNQVTGNEFYYLKIEAEKHFPADGKHLVFLGDQTGIGHFCALWQLAAKNAQISGIITFNNQQTADAFSENCSWLPLQSVSNDGAIYRQTADWAITHQTKKGDYMFYVVGSAKLVVTLKKLLQTHGFIGSQIKSKGFWH